MARVLVAEDEASVRSFVRRALEHYGHEVVVVEDGQQALERLMRERFDLLVTDIVMPHLDGISLALKATRDWPGMAILLMTGYPAERQRAFDLDALIDRVVLKPFSLDDLLGHVAAALAARPAR
ncbi:MAG: response regulator [Alphaproteobacteria bacterium]|nr:response regulator [Alphaproteobacteria bacterium]